MSLEEVLNRAARTIQSGDLKYEENGKQTIIEPILYELGWDQQHLSQVVREYAPNPNRHNEAVDYALILEGKPCVFFEVKSLHESLNKAKIQAINYGDLHSTKSKVPLLVCTDSQIWHFYIDIGIEKPDYQLFHIISIETVATGNATLNRHKQIEEFRLFLSKASLESGDAFEEAKKYFKYFQNTQNLITKSNSRASKSQISRYYFRGKEVPICARSGKSLMAHILMDFENNEKGFLNRLYAFELEKNETLTVSQNVEEFTRTAKRKMNTRIIELRDGWFLFYDLNQDKKRNKIELYCKIANVRFGDRENGLILNPEDWGKE